EQIRASSEEVAAAARRANQGAAQAASLVGALERQSGQLRQHTREVVAAGDETRAAGAEMEKTTEKVRQATQAAVRRLADLGTTTEESAREVHRLRDVAEQVEKVSETIGLIANQTNLLARNATIEAARGTARAGKRVAELAHGIDDQSGTISGALGQAKAAAQTSTQEAEAVAAAAVEQRKAIEGLARGAAELAALADHLAKAVRLVRGDNGRQ